MYYLYVWKEYYRDEKNMPYFSNNVNYIDLPFKSAVDCHTVAELSETKHYQIKYYNGGGKENVVYTSDELAKYFKHLEEKEKQQEIDDAIFIKKFNASRTSKLIFDKKINNKKFRIIVFRENIERVRRSFGVYSDVVQFRIYLDGVALDEFKNYYENPFGRYISSNGRFLRKKFLNKSHRTGLTIEDSTEMVKYMPDILKAISEHDTNALYKKGGLY